MIFNIGKFHLVWFQRPLPPPPSPPKPRPSARTSSYLSTHLMELSGENTNPVQCDYRRCFNRGVGLAFLPFFVVTLTFENITD